MKDLTDRIIAYEQGDLSEAETVELFGELVRTGAAWTLQGHYGRTARGMIEQGLITAQGAVVGAAEESVPYRTLEGIMADTGGSWACTVNVRPEGQPKVHVEVYLGNSKAYTLTLMRGEAAELARQLLEGGGHDVTDSRCDRI